MLYAELGRYPLEITIKYRMISFWLRLNTGEISILSYIYYVFMLKTEYINSKWIICIQRTPDNSSKHDIWTHQRITITISIK